MENEQFGGENAPAPAAFEKYPTQNEIDRVNNFKEKYSRYADFLQNPEFERLINDGIEPILLDPDGEEYEKLLAKRPERSDHVVQATFSGAEGFGIKIIYKNEDGAVKIADVPQERMSHEDIDATGMEVFHTPESSGKSVAETMNNLGLANKDLAAFVEFPENTYELNTIMGKRQNLDGGKIKEGIKLYFLKQKAEQSKN